MPQINNLLLEIMIGRFIVHNKIPILLSITLSVVILALRVERDLLAIFFIVFGTLLGTCILDLDYILYAYFLDPTADFSVNFIAFIKHRDFGGAIKYLAYHRHDVKDKALNSVVFQVVLVAAALYVLTAPVALFLKCLILSILLQSIYKLLDLYMDNSAEEWFWILKTKPTKSGLIAYLGIILILFVYLLTLI